MERIDKAVKVLTEAESELRELLKHAAAEGSYGDVTRVARAAEALAAVIADTTRHSHARQETVTCDSCSPSSQINEASAVNNRGNQSFGEGEPRRRRTRAYPRFERDGDRLVKVGWSKKDRREYEHRASKEAVFSVAFAVAKCGENGSLFSMDDVLPVQGADESEVPSYQAYLALAWLRDIKVVVKKGKDGYMVDGGELDTVRLEGLWESVSTR